MKKITIRSNCPISYLLDVLGDKWSLLIVRDILLRGKFSFNEFKISEERIATNILADRLGQMENAEIIFKVASPKNKSKFIYQLTPKGLDLLPILISMMTWGDRYYPETAPTPKNIIKSYNEDPMNLIADYQKRLQSALNL